MNQVRANLQVKVDPGQDFPCENQLYRVPRQRASLHPGTCIRRVWEKSAEVLICQQVEFFRVIRCYFAYVEREKIMRGCGSIISAAKVCDCVISAWC